MATRWGADPIHNGGLQEARRPLQGRRLHRGGQKPIHHRRGYEGLEKKLRLHIENEQEMQEAAKQLIDEVNDERVQKPLIMIYEDELMHHPFLESLLEVILKREMITEEDIWSMLFRDLPTHGHVADPYAEREYGP